MVSSQSSLDRITRTRLFFSAIGSILSIALAMFFIGTLVFFAFFSMKYIQNLSQKVEMEILFYSDVKEADIVTLEQRLKMEPYISQSRFYSKEENTAEAIKTIGNDFTEIIVNPINASILLNVTPEYANGDSIKAVVKKIKQNANVQDVEYPEALVKTVLDNFIKVQMAIVVICTLFMLISMMLIGNSIRLNIYSKRFSIRSMLLIGATRAFVRKPFLANGFVQGVWGGGFASILVALTLLLGRVILPEFVDFQYINQIALLLISLFVFSILFTLFVSFLSVNRYIKLNRDELYL
ncbi:MAG: permease-like cell division protein FtsX [Bacteroidales bacterium]|jgi:cell division transport system permease protein|nr:permease-like cell division protein FtsX [Bacteroidales bacterium]